MKSWSRSTGSVSIPALILIVRWAKWQIKTPSNRLVHSHLIRLWSPDLVPFITFVVSDRKDRHLLKSKPLLWSHSFRAARFEALLILTTGMSRMRVRMSPTSSSKVWTRMIQDFVWFVIWFIHKDWETLGCIIESFLKIVESQGFHYDYCYLGVPAGELLSYFKIRKHLTKQPCCMVSGLKWKSMLRNKLWQAGRKDFKIAQF